MDKDDAEEGEGKRGDGDENDDGDAEEVVENAELRMLVITSSEREGASEKVGKSVDALHKQCWCLPQVSLKEQPS